jgi:hypothetical protein
LTNLASNNAANLTNFPALLLRTNGSAANLTNFPTLNQNTTGTASNVTGVVAIANGGTGATNASNARTALGLGETNNVTFSNITASGTLTATGNVTMSGTANTAPSQTASSGSSLMTRDLSDARYGNIFFDELAADQSFTGTTNQNTLLSVVLPAGTYFYDSVISYITQSSTAGATISLTTVGATDYTVASTIDGRINTAPSLIRGGTGVGSGTFVIAIATDPSMSNHIRHGVATGVLKLAAERTMTVTAAQRGASDTTNALTLKEGSFVLFRKIQ